MAQDKISKYTSIKPDENGFVNYLPVNHEVWSILVKRQKKLIENRACEDFIKGVEILGFTEQEIPQHNEVTRRLEEKTGWGVEVVDAVIPAKDFFTLLANKKFPAASFIRTKEDLDYLQEPDIFHEFFGHCPLLTNKSYAHFMHRYGQMALDAEPKRRKILFRLFWFTIEFGLIQTDKGLKIFGGGILSSADETVYALESEIPKRVPFDPLTAMRTPFRIDIKQPLYYIIDDIADLYGLLDDETRTNQLIDQAIELGDLEPLFPPRPKH